MLSTRLQRSNRRLLPSLHNVWPNRYESLLTIASVRITSPSQPALAILRGTSRCSQILHKGALYDIFPTMLKYNVSAVLRLSAAVRTTFAFDGGLYTVHTVHFCKKKYILYCFDSKLWVFVSFVVCVFKTFPF